MTKAKKKGKEKTPAKKSKKEKELDSQELAQIAVLKEKGGEPLDNKEKKALIFWKSRRGKRLNPDEEKWLIDYKEKLAEQNIAAKRGEEPQPTPQSFVQSPEQPVQLPKPVTQDDANQVMAEKLKRESEKLLKQPTSQPNKPKEVHEILGIPKEKLYELLGNLSPEDARTYNAVIYNDPEKQAQLIKEQFPDLEKGHGIPDAFKLTPNSTKVASMELHRNNPAVARYVKDLGLTELLRLDVDQRTLDDRGRLIDNALRYTIYKLQLDVKHDPNLTILSIDSQKQLVLAVDKAIRSETNLKFFEDPKNLENISRGILADLGKRLVIAEREEKAQLYLEPEDIKASEKREQNINLTNLIIKTLKKRKADPILLSTIEKNSAEYSPLIMEIFSNIPKGESKRHDLEALARRAIVEYEWRKEQNANETPEEKERKLLQFKKYIRKDFPAIDEAKLAKVVPENIDLIYEQMRRLSPETDEPRSEGEIAANLNIAIQQGFESLSEEVKKRYNIAAETVSPPTNLDEKVNDIGIWNEEQTLAYLGIEKEDIEHEIKRKKLNPIRKGNERHYDWKEVEALKASLTPTPSPEKPQSRKLIKHTKEEIVETPTQPEPKYTTPNSKLEYYSTKIDLNKALDDMLGEQNE